MRARPLTRRLAAVLAVAAFVAATAGCRVGKSDTTTEASPPSSIAVGQQLPAATVDAMVADLNMVSLRKTTLTVQSKFELHGHWTVLTTAGGSVLPNSGGKVDLKDLETAANQIAGLVDKKLNKFHLALERNGQWLDMTSLFNFREGQERPYVYVATSDLVQILHQETDPRSPSPQPSGDTKERHDAFTAFGHTTYIGSFISDEPGSTTSISFPIASNVTAQYVELCQNLYQLVTSAIDRKDSQQSEWKNQDFLAAQVAQESVCNGIGYATAVARLKPPVHAVVPYTDYANAVDKSTAKTFKGVTFHLYRMDPDTYNALRG